MKRFIITLATLAVLSSLSFAGRSGLFISPMRHVPRRCGQWQDGSLAPERPR